jgi:ATPase subunit of ABC transporter with duplicated ATPase domains
MSNFFAQGLKSQPIAVDNGFVSIPPEVRPARAPFSRGPVALRDGCAHALASTVVSVHVVETSDPAATEALGAQLAAGLHGGDIVLVQGELGTGKTTLVRGAARALGVRDPVTSPSFSIGHRYRAVGSYVTHLDLYRLGPLANEEA